MRYRNTLMWTALLLTLILVLAGCAPRPAAGDAAAAAAPDAVVIDLPALVLDVAEDGAISIGGVAISDLASSLGVPLELPLTADTVAQLTGAGVQHIQIANQPDGIGLVINGQPFPSLGWSQEELTTIGRMAGNEADLGALLPVLTQLGVGVTLRLPVAEGAEVAPLIIETDPTELTAAQENFLKAVGNAPTITIPVKYDLDGTWTVMGMNSKMLTRLTGQDFWTILDLRPQDVEGAMAAGIETFDLRTDSNGLHFVVNGEELPRIDWSDGKLLNVVDFLTESGLLAIPGLDAQGLGRLVNQILPILTTAKINISASFPTP